MVKFSVINSQVCMNIRGFQIDDSVFQSGLYFVNLKCQPVTYIPNMKFLWLYRNSRPVKFAKLRPLWNTRSYIWNPLMNISSCQASSHNRAYNIYVVCCDDAKNVASLLPFQSPCTYSLNHLDEVPVLFQAPERYLPMYNVPTLCTSH